MGCKYNIDEFKPFVSGRKRIVPEVSDDWELTAESFNTKDGVALYSPKLNTKIYDLNFRDFLKFLVNENVTMIGNKINGNFIIGQARVLRKESDYLQTISIKNKRTEVIIPKSKYKIGAKYETVCGEIITYLGERFVQRIIHKNGCAKWSKINKKQFGKNSNNYLVDITNRKFVKMISEPYETELDNENNLNTLLDKNYTYMYYYSIRKTKSEIEAPLEFVESKTFNYFFRYENLMVFIPSYREYNGVHLGYIIDDSHKVGELDKIEIRCSVSRLTPYKLKKL